MKNRHVQNIKSPKDEGIKINIYQKLNPSSKKADGLDITHVKTKNGEKGYALLKLEHNRSRDKNWHKGKDFISEKEIKKTDKIEEKWIII